MSEEIKSIFLKQSLKYIEYKTNVVKVEIKELRKKFAKFLKEHYADESSDGLTEKQKIEVKQIRDGEVSDRAFLKKYIESEKYFSLEEIIGLYDGELMHCFETKELPFQLERTDYECEYIGNGTELIKENAGKTLEHCNFENLTKAEVKYLDEKGADDFFINRMRKTKVDLPEPDKVGRKAFKRMPI